MSLTPDELCRVVRANVLARRRELKMTQAALAAAAGVHQPHVAAIERGAKIPTIETIAKLAEALRTTPDILLREDAFALPSEGPPQEISLPQPQAT